MSRSDLKMNGTEQFAGAEMPTASLPGAPGDLPTDPQDFWRPTVSLDDLTPPVIGEEMPALKRLGQPPFPRNGFPLMGFLATLYQHTAQHAKETLEKRRG